MPRRDEAPDVLFVCSKHDDGPAEYEDCMACGTLACLALLWRSCEVTLDIGAVRARLASFDGTDAADQHVTHETDGGRR